MVQLYLAGIDILEKEDIITYRANDLDLLMRIRNGSYQNSDGSFREEFFDMIDDLEKRFRYAADNTNLPEKADTGKIEDFAMAMNETSLTERNPMQMNLSHVMMFPDVEPTCGPVSLGKRNILFNQNKISEEAAYRCAEAGRYSPYVLEMPKEQYQGLFLDIDVQDNQGETGQ